MIPSSLYSPHSYDPSCIECGEYFPRARQLLGFLRCLECGESHARTIKHCIVPINKSAYQVVTDPDILKQLNPKRIES